MLGPVQTKYVTCGGAVAAAAVAQA